MITRLPYLFLVAFMLFFTVQLFGQTPAVSRPRPVLSPVSGTGSSQARKFLEQNGDGLPSAHLQPPATTSPTTTTAQPQGAAPLQPHGAVPHGAIPLGAPACTDTTGHILTTETNDLLAPGFITQTLDGNVLVPGFRFDLNTPYYNYPYLIKQSLQGSILWSKSFTGFGLPPDNTASAYRCFQLKDGTLLLVGSLSVPEPVNGSSDLVLWHLDANGNVLWQQTDSSTLWQQNAGSFYVADMTQDQTGNIFLAGNLYALGALTSHTFVLKIDGSGNIQWDNSFPASLSQCYGIFWTGSQLSMVGTNYDDYNDAYLWNMKLDPATGNMLSKKAWQGSTGQYNMFIGSWGSARLLANGNIGVSGTAFSDFAQTSNIAHGLVAEFDTSFNFLQGWMVQSNIQSNYYNTRFYQAPSGRISYTYMKDIDGYDEDILYGAIEQGQIVKERILHLRGRADAWTSNFLNVAPDEDIVLQEYSNNSTTQGDEFIRLHDSDTSSVCSGKDTSASWVAPFSMISYANPYWPTTYSNTFRQTIRILPPPVAGTPVQTTACTALASCNSIQLVANQTQVCAGSPATFTVLRNTGCGEWPVWNFDTTNIQSFQMPTDTTLQLIYRGPFQGTITAAMTGTCSSLSDAKQLTVISAGQSISLAANAWLCPDSTLVLRPGTGFSSYVWQDGSVSDTLVVTRPGTYSVTVNNACGTPMTASEVVQQTPSVNFSVGPALATCLDIPVTLQAPDGFLNYSWTSAANGSNYNTQMVTVTPTANTEYVAMAKTSLGCTVKSTIDVTVKIPLPVHLGDDTSFCAGDSITLAAGTGFTSYLWNNGATSPTIVAYQAGSYSVNALSPNGCYSNDTLQVSQVYPLPVVKLDADTTLCEGVTRILNAGAGYSSYAWQDGSIAPTLQVDTTGSYWVHVVDNNGCSGGDTVSITQILPNPQGFLVPDTVICNGFPSTIAAMGSFDSYLWSSGETTGSINVRQAGNYTLTVTDTQGCSATEEIAITTKQCLFGIFFPNAFTPDGNRTNNNFHPMVFGNMSHYHMQLFNRWGELVFATEDYSKGWDGSMNGALQPAGTYVWVCQYQFAGETAKLEKGTLLLIR
jgi:gliding motility-associated-like protein